MSAPYGVLGGTFDPVHLGHLHACREARALLGLGHVLLVPLAVPPHKARPGLVSAEDRLAMLRIAADDEPGIEVEPMEILRGGVSYTIDTLRALRAREPGAEPVFLLGIDAAREFRTWRSWREILASFVLAAVARPGAGTSHSDLSALLEVPVRPVPPCPDRFVPGRLLILSIPPHPASSSEVRRRAAAGEPLDGLVPPGVARYIQDHSLYREEVAR